MSQYIKKNRYQFAGVALPVFLLFLLVAIGSSVFPGWIKPSYGSPGATCGTISGSASDPVLTACDCNTEICVNSTCQVTTFPTCVNSISSNAIPGCWDSCVTSVQQLGTSGTFVSSVQCLPNNAFCDGISGGAAANPCRSAACTAVSTPDPANPSGCNYDLTTGTNCTLCATPAPSTFNACGNGICETGLGENATSCPIDCEVPGIGPGPLPTPGVLDNACAIPAITFITFSGPPYNLPFSGSCEDGDLCTVDTCTQSGTCSSTPASCSGNVGDFCCPSGCVAPASGGTCVVGAAGNNCDIDCYIPQQCVQPTPTPTPIPTPPILGGCVQGDGFSGSNGSLNCKGFTCAFNPAANWNETSTSGLALMAVFGLAAALWLRSREN